MARNLASLAITGLRCNSAISLKRLRLVVMDRCRRSGRPVLARNTLVAALAAGPCGCRTIAREIAEVAVGLVRNRSGLRASNIRCPTCCRLWVRRPMPTRTACYEFKDFEPALSRSAGQAMATRSR